MKIEIVGKFFDNHSLSIVNRNIVLNMYTMLGDDFRLCITPLDSYNPESGLNKKEVKILKELAAITLEDVDVPLKNFLKRTANWQKEIQRLDTLIRQRLENDFQLSKVYEHKKEFLAVPLQSTLTHSWFSETKLYQRLYNFYNLVESKVQQFKTTVEQESNLSTSEKIVRYVQTHQITNHNHHYTSIFLTKGYIGEAFWVERKFQMQHIEGLMRASN